MFFYLTPPRFFPETNEFIDSTLTEECEKERITVDEVINLLQVWK